MNRQQAGGSLHSPKDKGPLGGYSGLKAIAVAAALAGTVLLAACGNPVPNADTTGAGREVIDKPDKKITVIEATPSGVDSQMEVSAIDELTGVIGMDWLSDDKIIVGKDNTDMKPVHAEGEEQYPRNLYIRDLTAGDQADEALQPESANQTYALLSADKSHLFYKKNNEETARGYIMDMSTRQSVLAGKGTMRANVGEWVDNERVILPLMDGTIVTSDTQGRTAKLLTAKTYLISNVNQRGNTVYYTMEDSLLIAYDTVTKQQKPIDKGVVAFEPSPDGKQIAVVKMTSETERELTLTDANMNEELSLAKEADIFGISWSPDGTKLAYSANSSENGVNGVFVADVVSGKSTQISVDAQYGTISLRWSPFGSKLMTSTVVLKDDKTVPMTYIISF